MTRALAARLKILGLRVLLVAGIALSCRALDLEPAHVTLMRMLP